MTIEELDNIIRLYDGSPPLSGPLSMTEEELYHLAQHMKAILEAWQASETFVLFGGKDAIITKRLVNTLDHAIQPIYKERERQ